MIIENLLPRYIINPRYFGLKLGIVFDLMFLASIPYVDTVTAFEVGGIIPKSHTEALYPYVAIEFPSWNAPNHIRSLFSFDLLSGEVR